MKTSRFALVLVASVLSCASVHAGFVNWGLPQQITNGGDVSLTGTLVGAVNLDGPAASVNGVNFQALDINAGPATVGSFSVNGFFFNQFNPGFSTSSAAAPFSGLGATYRDILGTGAAVGGTMTLTMSNLALGQMYEFQAWVNDSRNQTPPGFTFQVDVSAGNTVTLDPNPSLADGGLGQFVIGTFMADSTSQQIDFTNSEVAVINAFQLRQLAAPPIPELGTALFGVAMIGASALSRRRSVAA